MPRINPPFRRPKIKRAKGEPGKAQDDQEQDRPISHPVKEIAHGHSPKDKRDPRRKRQEQILLAQRLSENADEETNLNNVDEVARLAPKAPVIPPPDDELELEKPVLPVQLPQVAAEEPGVRKQMSAMAALEDAQEPGVLFKDFTEGQGGDEDADTQPEVDPELHAAVEETIRLLYGVKGIHHVGPGQNAEGDKVVVVAAGPGFGEASMTAVPAQVQKFKTLIALPYDLLPLRREHR